MLPISNSEDDDGPSRVLVPALGLPVLATLHIRSKKECQ